MAEELLGPLAQHMEGFTGRTWLCLLTGFPGTGKSMVMAWLAGYGPTPADLDARAQLQEIRAQVAATHFCRAASRSIAPRAFVESIVPQLDYSVPGFFDMVLASTSGRPAPPIKRPPERGAVSGASVGRLHLASLSEESAFDQAFREPLKALYAGGYAEPLLLLVDAIDEAQLYTGMVTLVQLLARVADLPHQVRVLASTHPDPRVLKYFSGTRSIDLVDDMPETCDDVRLYAEAQLAHVDISLGNGLRNRLVDQICNAAQGNFQYAELALADVAAGRLPTVSDRDDYPPPCGLTALYHQYLNQELGKNVQEWLEVFRPLLGLLAGAPPPGLTRCQLLHVLGQDATRALRACAPYIEGALPDGPFRLYHMSFAHFLLDDPDNVDYRIERASSLRQLARHSEALDKLKGSMLARRSKMAPTDMRPSTLPQTPSTAIYLPANVSFHIERFVGRTWLLPILLNWLEASEQRTLLLTGAPGCGKSMVMAWLAGLGPEPVSEEARLQLVQVRSHVKASHFCMAATGNISPRAFSEGISNQLIQNIEEWQVGAGDVIDRPGIKIPSIVSQVDVGYVAKGARVIGVMFDQLNLQGLPESEAFDLMFCQPLKDLYAGGYDAPVLILVDALDEALTYTGDINLVQLLAELRNLPHQVRILASTRPDPRVLKHFTHVASVDLINDSPLHVNDIRQYVDAALGSMGVSISTQQRRILANRICEGAQGNFLYARLVLSSLARRTEPFEAATLPLPEGLAGLYGRFLNRELGRDEDRWYQVFGPLLGLLAVTQPPGFTRSQLERILEHEMRPALRACRQFISGDLPDGPFRLFHQSFAEFLLQDEGNMDYHVDAATMHRRIARYYQVCCGDDWGMLDEYGARHLLRHLVGCDTSNRLGPIHADEYGIRHLVYHAIAAGRAAAIGNLVDLVLG